MPDRGARPLKDWRQGDIILAPFRLPVLAPAADGLAIRNHVAEHGIAIVSQSCDVVRPSGKTPWVQVAPLIRVDEDEIEAILRRKDPRRSIVPVLEGKGLAIDLDFCCSIEKEALAEYAPERGCTCDKSQTRLADDLSRHRGRFAFPDLFNDEIAAPVRNWFKEKVKREGAAGDFAREVAEVRVLCDDIVKPSEITLWLMLDNSPSQPLPDEWASAIETLERRASKSSNFPDVGVVAQGYDDISASEYRNTFLLSWEDIS